MESFPVIHPLSIHYITIQTASSVPNLELFCIALSWSDIVWWGCFLCQCYLTMVFPGRNSNNSPSINGILGDGILSMLCVCIDLSVCLPALSTAYFICSLSQRNYGVIVSQHLFLPLYLELFFMGTSKMNSTFKKPWILFNHLWRNKECAWLLRLNSFILDLS